METNPMFPPPLAMVVRSGETNELRWGCSLSAQLEILREYVYNLFVYSGFDSLFVHEQRRAHADTAVKGRSLAA
eukprot:1680593-Amphidinium_carterae.1